MPDWKLGIRLEVLPGDGLVERFASAACYGFDAVELPGRHLPDCRDELMANIGRLALPVSSVSLGFRGSLVSADAEGRPIGKGALRMRRRRPRGGLRGRTGCGTGSCSEEAVPRTPR